MTRIPLAVETLIIGDDDAAVSIQSQLSTRQA